MLDTIPEKQFLNQIIKLADIRGWLVYHTHDSRRSQAGFPDLVMVRGGRIIFAEIKSEKGRTSPEQKVWIKYLRTAKRKDVFLWRPSDWKEIETELA